MFRIFWTNNSDKIMVGVMSKKNMPDSNADIEKNEEIHQIENWLEELPEFD